MPRVQLFRELLADGIVHVIGVSLSIFAMIWLAVFSAQSNSTIFLAAVITYALAVVFSFTASAIYNIWPAGGVKQILRRFDHAGIHLKIAGTFTPLVVFFGSTLGYVVLGAVWLAAVVGSVAKLAFKHLPKKVTVLLYMAQGWAAVFLIWPMIQNLSLVELTLIGLGGLVYSAGVIFHVREEWRYNKAIWHGFVLTASSLFFVAIALVAMR